MSAKVGVLIPAGNTTVEKELVHCELDVATLHVQRMTAAPDAYGEAAIRSMDADAASAAAVLSAIDPQVMVFGCTIGSVIDGKATEEKLRVEIAEVTAAPLLLAGRCVVDALNYLGTTKVAIGSATESWMVEAMATYLADYGIQTLHTHALGYTGAQLSSLSNEQIVGLALDADTAQAQAIVLFGTSLPGIPAIAAAEQALGKPVLTSNASVLWSLHRTLGADPTGLGPGILFSAETNSRSVA